MSQQKILQPLTAKILLINRDLRDTIFNTAVLPRINETQGKAFTIHNRHLTHKYSNLDLMLKPKVNLLDMEE